MAASWQFRFGPDQPHKPPEPDRKNWRSTGQCRAPRSNRQLYQGPRRQWPFRSWTISPGHRPPDQPPLPSAPETVPTCRCPIRQESTGPARRAQHSWHEEWSQMHVHPAPESDWQTHDKPCAQRIRCDVCIGWTDILGPDYPAMRLDDLFADRQTQAGVIAEMFVGAL